MYSRVFRQIQPGPASRRPSSESPTTLNRTARRSTTAAVATSTTRRCCLTISGHASPAIPRHQANRPHAHGPSDAISSKRQRTTSRCWSLSRPIVTALQQTRSPTFPVSHGGDRRSTQPVRSRNSGETTASTTNRRTGLTACAFNDLRLPGSDPAALSIPDLHKTRPEQVGLGKIAAELYDPDTVRAALQTHPLPTCHPRNRRNNLARPRRAGAPKREEGVTAERFRDPTTARGHSLREVAAMVGVRRQTFARLLLATTRCPCAKPAALPTTPTIQSGYIDQYVKQARPLPAIAKDREASSAVSRWAHQSGIPLRHRGGTQSRR